MVMLGGAGRPTLGLGAGEEPARATGEFEAEVDERRFEGPTGIGGLGEGFKGFGGIGGGTIPGG